MKPTIISSCFDLSYYRHTAQWFCLYQSVSLAEAFHLIESNGHFHPPCSGPASLEATLPLPQVCSFTSGLD